MQGHLARQLVCNLRFPVHSPHAFSWFAVAHVWKKSFRVVLFPAQDRPFSGHGSDNLAACLQTRPPLCYSKLRATCVTRIPQIIFPSLSWTFALPDKQGIAVFCSTSQEKTHTLTFADQGFCCVFRRIHALSFLVATKGICICLVCVGVTGVSPLDRRRVGSLSMLFFEQPRMFSLSIVHFRTEGGMVGDAKFLSGAKLPPLRLPC